MRPQTIGRVLGIGIRVAGRLAGQRLASGATARPVTIQGIHGPTTGRATGRNAGRVAGNLGRGLGGFVRPFQRLGGILFLEVVGVFFFIFVLVFGQMVLRSRASFLHGPDHQKFLVAGGLMLVFLYLSVSSFWRARRK
ncbi:MAG TPA: hypothetical protein VGG85_10655 [Terracidiphilus sp.]